MLAVQNSVLVKILYFVCVCSFPSDDESLSGNVIAMNNELTGRIFLVLQYLILLGLAKKLMKLLISFYEEINDVLFFFPYNVLH